MGRLSNSTLIEHTDMYFQGELYRGWWILAVLEEGGWIVECHNSKGEIYITQKAYETAAKAVNAANCGL